MLARSNAVDFKVALKWLSLAIVLLGAADLLFGADTVAISPRFSREQLDFYEKQVRPILADNCFKCHSHQAEKIKGSLVLDSRDGLLKGGDTGPAIVPGEPDISLLIRAVRHVDEDLQMPPKKQLPAAQIDVLAEWIKMGAPCPETSNAFAAMPKGRRATTSDTNWWSFQPLRDVKVPEVADRGWSRSAIDKFIFAKLNSKGLTPSPEAERSTLIRRVYFDLIGLPPSAAEVEHFLADKSPDAYERLIEDLLSRPQYGEKWARHWLDLVRYAESDGFKSDTFRPNAWRYRDYVIRSFNDDKPYNRFLMEQVAADELWPESPDSLIGVGYLRLPIYEYNQRNVKAQWATTINDITDVTSDAFLGLGLQCARCHDHKFDPILQRDYYRFQAFFAALWPRDELPLATPGDLKKYQAQITDWENKTADLRARIEALERPVREKTAKGVVEKFPREIQAIMNKPAGERTPYERQINDLAYRQVQEELEKLDGKFRGVDKEKLDTLRKQLSGFDEFKPAPLPAAMLVTDVGPTAPPVTLPKDKTQHTIEPGLLTLLSEAPVKIEPAQCATNSTGRRATLAYWLARPDNRFTSRVMVNRLWQRHFGQGLVATLNDFGHLGDEPTHPELLDWLARYFVEHGWSIKEMHRLILNSATYRQSAAPATTVAQVQMAERVDPENRWLWRQTLHRLESDQIRDAMLSASGELDPKFGGPSVDASKPRRTIYTKWLRNSRDPLLDAFDPPDAYTSTPQRNVTTTPMQSLVMINGSYALQRAQALAGRIKQLHPNPAGTAKLVESACRFVYGRGPSPAESSAFVAFLDEQSKRIAGSKPLALANTETMPKRAGTAAAFRANGQTRLQVPDNHLMPQYDFTVEAFIQLRSIDNGAEPRTIVSRWDGRKDQPGWSLGVSGKNSNCQTQSLVLELIGDPAEDGAGGYEMIVSGLQPELDTPCYVAVSVRIGDTSETGVTFYLKELTAGAPVHTARVSHKVTANHQSNLALIIGGRDPDKHQIWDGLIDDVRLSRRALTQDELLINRDRTDESTVGYWRFEEPDFFKDSSPNGHNIKSEISPAAHLDPNTAALIDFCHVLLNSNEFLYTE